MIFLDHVSYTYLIENKWSLTVETIQQYTSLYIGNENILCLGQNDIDKYESNVHAQCNYVATF